MVLSRSRAFASSRCFGLGESAPLLELFELEQKASSCNESNVQAARPAQIVWKPGIRSLIGRKSASASAAFAGATRELFAGTNRMSSPHVRVVRRRRQLSGV